MNTINQTYLTYFTEQINLPSSKVITLQTAEYIIKKPQSLDVLYQLIWEDKLPKSWKASWILEHVFLDKPRMIDAYLADMITKFPHIKADGTKRHISKILAFSEINEIATGDFLNTCFEWLMSKSIPVAVKSNCISILVNLSKIYPELKQELIACLETEQENNSAAFKGRMNQVIHQLR